MSVVTNRLKLSVFAEDNEDWVSKVNHWPFALEAIIAQMLSRQYVENGFDVTGTSGLDITYNEGDVNISGTSAYLAGATPTLTDDSYNWIFVRSGSVVISTSPPGGAVDYCMLYCVRTESSAISEIGDFRYTYPRVNGITISPLNINPTGNINMAASKRIYHSDALVGSNVVMLGTKQNLKSWTNQTSVKAWTELACTSYVSSVSKFAIVGLYCATYGTLADRWANLRCRKNSSMYENQYTAIDYGHPSAEAIDGNVIGQAHCFTIPFDTGLKLSASVTLPSVGIGSGSYYAYVDLLGYIL
jgi:hypothetical protein